MADYSFRAKTYNNRKGEARLQVSGLQADFDKSTSDKEALNALVKAIKEGLGSKTK